MLGGNIAVHGFRHFRAGVLRHIHRTDGLLERILRGFPALLPHRTHFGEAFLSSGACLGEHGDYARVHLRSAGIEHLRHLRRKLTGD